MIRTTELTKTYGALHALQGIDLEVEEGEICGFIGPNGAGKTTTIRILTTLLPPTSGDAFVAEHSVRKDPLEVRRVLGYMPDTFGVYRDMTVEEYLQFFAAAYAIPHRERGGLVSGLLELTDLTYKREALVETLSRGMQQRLGLARALVHDPKVLVLDEPASGLDPRARIEIREVLRELSGMGKTILLSSHILSELSEICTRLAILERGALVAQGTPEELATQAGGTSVIELGTTDDARAQSLLEAWPEARVVDQVPGGPGLEVTLTDGTDPAALAAHLHHQGVGVRRLVQQDLSLEQAFLKLTKGLVQ